MLLRVHELRVCYTGSVPVVRDISFNVKEGSCTAFIGPNGSGKSTVVKAITGLQPPTSGEVWFAGKRIDSLPIHKIAGQGIALVPEERRLFPDMTTIENLQLGAYENRNQREVKEGVEKVFTYFPRLKERRSLLAKRLSGGEQQMLAIGRALMARPKLLLMDEPSFGLSPILVMEIERIVEEIKEHEGMTILVMEQNARLALSLGEYCYVMETGSITLEGETSKLIQDERVKHAYLGL